MDVRELATRHVEVQTRAPFDDVLERFEAQLGRHDPAAYFPLLTDPAHAEEVRAIIKSQVGSSGLMIFSSLQVGLLLAMSDRPTKARQYWIGNSVYAFEMVRHDIRAGLYAPLRVLIYDDAAGEAIFEYDEPSSLFGWLDNPRIDAVASDLDKKLASLVRIAAM